MAAAAAAAAAAKAKARAKAKAPRACCLGLLERPAAPVVRVAVTGREGAGKSVLIEALLGLGGAMGRAGAGAAGGGVGGGVVARHHARTPGLAVREAAVQLPRSGTRVVLSLAEAGGAAAASYAHVAEALTQGPARAAVHVVAPGLPGGGGEEAAEALRAAVARCEGLPAVVVCSARAHASSSSNGSSGSGGGGGGGGEGARAAAGGGDALSVASGSTASTGSPGMTVVSASTQSTTSSGGARRHEERRAALEVEAELLGLPFVDVDLAAGDGEESSSSDGGRPAAVTRLLELLEDKLNL